MIPAGVAPGEAWSGYTADGAPLTDAHGPDPATWFARGVWPTCLCGEAPRDNRALTAHWRSHGFTVTDVGGRLVRRAIVPGVTP